MMTQKPYEFLVSFTNSKMEAKFWTKLTENCVHFKESLQDKHLLIILQTKWKFREIAFLISLFDWPTSAVWRRTMRDRRRVVTFKGHLTTYFLELFRVFFSISSFVGSITYQYLIITSNPFLIIYLIHMKRLKALCIRPLKLEISFS